MGERPYYYVNVSWGEVHLWAHGPYLFGCHWCLRLLFLFILVRDPWRGCILLRGPDHRPPDVHRLHFRS